MKHVAAVIVAMMVGFIASAGTTTTNAPARYEEFAKALGWLTEFRRGHEIVQKLTTQSPEGLRKLGIAVYRDEIVSFVGGGAPPGGTNDLITENGFYLRVVNPSGKDLRPHSMGWGVIVRGKILQVLPENKIIVIEVNEKDWTVIQTG